MKALKNSKSVVISICGLAVATLMSVMPVSSIHAENNNPSGNTMPECTSDLDNNYGTIEMLLAGNVGCNRGTIEVISNTGSLGVNEATVGINNSGNIIQRNDGTITNNYGIVVENYKDITNNYGTVTMKSGSKIENNYKRVGQKAIFDGDGTVGNNEGEIEISSCSVTVTTNTGTIILKDGATLTCTNNYGDIVKADGAAAYKCTCTKNYGKIGFSSNSDGTTSCTNNYYKIVFTGDDGKASVTFCEAQVGADYYTVYGSYMIKFTLSDAGYACKDATYNTTDSTWQILSSDGVFDDRSKTCTITCHKCAASGYSYDETSHRQLCTVCNRLLSEAAHISVVDPRVEPTETSSGLTEGSHCSICGKILVAQTTIPKKGGGGSGTHTPKKPTSEDEPANSTAGPTVAPKQNNSKGVAEPVVSPRGTANTAAAADKTQKALSEDDVVTSDSEASTSDDKILTSEDDSAAGDEAIFDSSVSNDDASSVEENVVEVDKSGKKRNNTVAVVVTATVIAIGAAGITMGLKLRKRKE